MIYLTLRVQYNKKLYTFYKKIGRKKGRKFKIFGRKFGKKKDKNEKFYFAKVEALVLSCALDNQMHFLLTSVAKYQRHARTSKRTYCTGS